MTHEILIARSITKSFGHDRVIRKLDLTISKGEIYVLFGSNGAGKTTLIKILSTLSQADSGEVTLFGMETEENVRKIRARIGFMSHEAFLYDDLTAWENLNFYADLYSVGKKEARIKEMLKMVGLYHRSHDKVRSFSRGMLQRLSLARAVLHDPELIFLDEPYSGLDIRAQEVLNDLIIKLNSKGKTFLIITHDIEKGFGIANRKGILSNGAILLDGEHLERTEFSEKYNEILRREAHERS